MNLFKSHARPAARWAVMAICLLAFASCARALTPGERKIVTGLKAAITELHGKLAEAETANRNYLNSIAKAGQEATVLQETARVAQTEAAVMAAERDQLAEKLAVQNVKIERLNHRYQTAQMIIALSVAGFALILALQLGAGLPAQYRVAVALGAAGAAAATVYVLL